MGKKALLIIIVVLAAVVLVGWVLTASNNSGPGTAVGGTNNTPIVHNPSPSPAAVAPSPASGYTPSVDVQKLLAENPGAGATTEQLKTFSAKVSGYSVETSSFDVSGCVPNPTVARVTLQKPLTFKNTDAAAHKLVNGNIIINVPANNSVTVAPSFAGPGIYGYSCDSKISGIFLVVP